VGSIPITRSNPLLNNKNVGEDGAQRLIITGMGHALPTTLWPRIVEAIAAHAARADAPGRLTGRPPER
jgi:hypothetical protein